MKRSRPRRFSQHFLNSSKIAQRIVAGAGIKGKTVIEVGAGRGILTAELANQAREVYAIELDYRMINGLQALSLPDVRVIHDDFLRHDIKQYGQAVVVGNIPYSLSSSIIEKLIDNRATIASATLTVQREFAHRLMAQPGTRSFGFISLYVSCFFIVSKLFAITSRFFTPPPGVNSTVIRLDRKSEPSFPAHNTAFLNLLRAVFRYPRKAVKNALKNAGVSVPSRIDRKILEKRPASLSAENIKALYRSFVADEDR